jgi:hypothetical protein
MVIGSKVFYRSNHGWTFGVEKNRIVRRTTGSKFPDGWRNVVFLKSLVAHCEPQRRGRAVDRGSWSIDFRQNSSMLMLLGMQRRCVGLFTLLTFAFPLIARRFELEMARASALSLSLVQEQF